RISRRATRWVPTRSPPLRTSLDTECHVVGGARPEISKVGGEQKLGAVVRPQYQLTSRAGCQTRHSHGSRPSASAGLPRGSHQNPSRSGVEEYRQSKADASFLRRART